MLEPISVNIESFDGKDIGLKSYKIAEKEDIAIVYIGESRDGKTESGPIELESRYSVDTNEHIKNIKKIKSKGRCLHFDAGNSCTDFSKAHSIQKKKMLSALAENGHVYGINLSFTSFKSSSWRERYKKTGINTISTFLGFCSYHDNKVFEKIDNQNLLPSVEQAALYGYRSLCKEVHAKQNAIMNLKDANKSNENPAVDEMLKFTILGNTIGLANLNREKKFYEESIRNNRYSDFEFVLFRTEQNPNIGFSSVLYPDFDFFGRPLQDLSNMNKDLKLIAFNSAPIDNGWGFLFVWHKKSKQICRKYIKTLMVASKKRRNYGEYLFRLAAFCENHAFSPSWWEQLPEESKQAIVDRFSDAIDNLADLNTTYLADGFQNFAEWEFTSIISNIGIDINFAR